MGNSTGPLEDRKSEKRLTEIKRVWGHGSEGQGDKCYRASRPVYTDVQKTPGECRSCDNNEWLGKGKVERLKGSKEIIRNMP